MYNECMYNDCKYKMFHVEHSVLADLYIWMYKYFMKKKRKAVKKRGRIAQLRASADGENLPPDVVPEWRRYYKPLKKPVTLRLDADVLAWLKKQGPGYQTRINRALRKLMSEDEG
jgi:uncharacterized protein (DUF4415 family)